MGIFKSGIGKGNKNVALRKVNQSGNLLREAYQKRKGEELQRKVKSILINLMNTLDKCGFSYEKTILEDEFDLLKRNNFPKERVVREVEKISDMLKNKK